MIHFKTIGAAALVVALATGSAVAQGPRGGREGRGGGPGGPFRGVAMESLNLTQAQQDQIQALRERNRQEVQALQERMRSDILALLTAEQQAKLKQLEAEQGPRRGRGQK